MKQCQLIQALDFWMAEEVAQFHPLMSLKSHIQTEIMLSYLVVKIQVISDQDSQQLYILQILSHLVRSKTQDSLLLEFIKTLA